MSSSLRVDRLTTPRLARLSRMRRMMTSEFQMVISVVLLLMVIFEACMLKHWCCAYLLLFHAHRFEWINSRSFPRFRLVRRKEWCISLYDPWLVCWSYLTKKDGFYVPLFPATKDKIRAVVNVIHQPLSRSIGKSSPSPFSKLMLSPSSGGKGVGAWTEVRYS